MRQADRKAALKAAPALNILARQTGRLKLTGMPEIQIACDGESDETLTLMVARAIIG